MKVFVWPRIKKCTDRYHSEGGAVVFAETEERAKEIARENGCYIVDDELKDVREVDGKEAIYIMPDAGCC